MFFYSLPQSLLKRHRIARSAGHERTIIAPEVLLQSCHTPLFCRTLVSVERVYAHARHSCFTTYVAYRVVGAKAIRISIAVCRGAERELVQIDPKILILSCKHMYCTLCYLLHVPFVYCILYANSFSLIKKK